MAEEFQHQYFASQLLSTSNLHFGKHARELFIPKGNKIAIRSVFVHPVAIRSDVLERYDTAHFANVDYGMIPNIVFDEKRIFLTGVQSDCYLTNFCENERVFETEPSPFKQSIFIRAHEYSYRVQRKLFSFEQLVPCAKESEEIPEVDESWRLMLPLG